MSKIIQFPKREKIPRTTYFNHGSRGIFVEYTSRWGDMTMFGPFWLKDGNGVPVSTPPEPHGIQADNLEAFLRLTGLTGGRS